MTNRSLATASFVVAALLVMYSVAAHAQTFPQPTAEQQKGIDKDISRHFGDAPADPGPLAPDLSPALTARDLDKAMRKVADWQLARAQPYFDRIWTWSVLYSGFMAASEATGDPKYRDAMKAMATKYNWELRNKLPNADDQSVGQTYLELYLQAGKEAEAGDDCTDARGAGFGDQFFHAETRRSPHSVVVVRRAVHGAPGVGADVCGDGRAQVHRLPRCAMAAHIGSAL